MFNVIVLDSSERLARNLLVLLGQLFVVAYAGDEMISCPGKPPELLLCHRDSRCRVTGPHTVAVLGEGGCSDVALPAGTLLVAESTNPTALALAEKDGLTLFSCGLAAGDMLTLSSIGEHDAVLSLTQSVRTLTGGVAEPFELPLALTRMPLPFALLAAAGVAILTGKAGSLPAVAL